MWKIDKDKESEVTILLKSDEGDFKPSNRLDDQFKIKQNNIRSEETGKKERVREIAMKW